MKSTLTIITFFFLLSCSESDKQTSQKQFQIILSDTTGNPRAKWNLDQFTHSFEIAKQLSLEDITKGTDSFEVRFWYDFSFSSMEELYVLKCKDSLWTVTNFHFFLRPYDYDHRVEGWNPFIQPIVDSSESKTMHVKKEIVDKYLSKKTIDGIWFLKSQCDLNIPKEMGFSDCDSYSMEIATKEKYMFLFYHCPISYFERTKNPNITSFMNYVALIQNISRESNATVPIKFE